MTSNESILEAYRKCDFLNGKGGRPLVKILVSYIRPSFLFKSQILTPIHLGRAVEGASSKDGGISAADLEWLHANCLSDDDVEGSISRFNRRLGFFTGTYWAWKNYDRIGDPEYFGSFGYRKLLDPCLLDGIERYDAILPEPWNPCADSLKRQMIDCHGEEAYREMMRTLTETHPEDVSLADEYFAGKSGYYHELYVMKKSRFFGFCRWIYPMLMSLLKIDHYIGQLCLTTGDRELAAFVPGARLASYCASERRDVAFIAERLTGLFLYKIRRENPSGCREVKCHNASSVIRTTMILEEMRRRMRASAGIAGN